MFHDDLFSIAVQLDHYFVLRLPYLFKIEFFCVFAEARQPFVFDPFVGVHPAFQKGTGCRDLVKSSRLFTVTEVH